MNHTGTNPPNNPKISVVAVIPARYESARLPGKPVLEIAGKPMICWVVERALAARNVQRAIVATDDRRILQAVTDAGYEAVMTRSDHASGTDRIAEVANSLGEAKVVVNVQGDEPLISPQTIERAVDELLLNDDTGMVTAWEPMTDPADVLSPDVVKIVVDTTGTAIYFSRAAVPYPRDAVRQQGTLQAALCNDASCLAGFRKHTGLYVYRREVLLAFAKWPQSILEQRESLEQLRALENGVRIKAIETSTPSIAVDTAEDLERVRALVETAEFQSIH